MEPQLIVREAKSTDLEELKHVNYDKTPAVHRDRIRDADEHEMRYLVVEQNGLITGYAVLVFQRPPSWPDADSQENLPQIVDLYVRPEQRGKGVGSFFIRQMEGFVINAGGDRLFVAVDPVDNPRAHALYLRLGYIPLEPEPYQVHWHFTDSDGNRHEGEDWNINLMRQLATI
jgi:GNAT superfamily N-acetyltransferase